MVSVPFLSACYRGITEHDGETMLKRSAAVFVAVLVDTATSVVSVLVAQPIVKCSQT